MEPGNSAGTITQFIPLIVTGLALLALAWPMTKRKGLPAGYAILCFLPLIGVLVLIWIASKPDKELLERVAKIEGSQRIKTDRAEGDAS
ncbi:hypothetical protein [Actibacterium pelagium]|uniref:Uncharacterized protein n=1 Tax=Actibacterium pelagium TaxID=2029103 RepID=A0A917AI13_9RHOB|nr:hypothetical protein [Actibacterium pelagium]GGE53460.1 hypothetical protein GCM10011517_21480 [Actibacterium pelagium]